MDSMDSTNGGRLGTSNPQQASNDQGVQIFVAPVVVESVYTYAIKNVDGSFQLLGPVGTTSSGQGLAVLPQPQGTIPEGVFLSFFTPGDTLQGEDPSGLENEQYEESREKDQVQARIDAIIASTTTPSKPARHNLGYCKNWLQQGKCLNTGIPGCSYSHELPEDPELLKSLGFDGLPGWFLESLSPEDRLVEEEIFECRRGVQQSIEATTADAISPVSRPSNNRDMPNMNMQIEGLYGDPMSVVFNNYLVGKDIS